jgi:hypothetical protein
LRFDRGRRHRLIRFTGNESFPRKATSGCGSSSLLKKVSMKMDSPLLHDLNRLDDIIRSLAAISDFKEVKAIRDRAESARRDAVRAGLGLKIRNRAAELKLRAERRAGELLAGLIKRGGDHKSSARHNALTLAQLGIDHNRSTRWQHESAVPEAAFEQYLITANELGKEVTARGLLTWSARSN